VKLFKNVILITVVPLLLLADFISRNQQYEAFWQGRIAPDYPYLFNSLSLAYYYGDIGHTDHPGTPVQFLGAVIIKLTYWFQNSPENLIIHILKNPELYLY